MGTKNGQRQNALKHGAFQKELEIFGEDEAAFAELRRSIIEEFQAFTPALADTAAQYAECIWREQRATEFFAERIQSLDIPEQRLTSEERENLTRICILIGDNPSCKDAWALVSQLPLLVRNEMESLFVGPPNKEEWS